MGGLFTRFRWGGNPDEVNPVSGLTRREVYAVQKSWAPLNANAVDTGTELLKRYFRAYPEAKEFFKMIRNTSEEEYDQNIQFKAHVINLISALNLAVTNLNAPEIVIAMMHKVGESHNRRQIQEKYFQDLKTTIVKMFIELLNMDEATLNAWAKAVDFLYKSIFSTLNNGEAR